MVELYPLSHPHTSETTSWWYWKIGEPWLVHVFSTQFDLLWRANEIIEIQPMSQFYFNNIAFIGGIHGGKSTVGKQLCLNRKVHYLSASELFKVGRNQWRCPQQKKADNPLTQDRLIEGLHHAVEKRRFYLFDGYYCLLNSAMEIVRVSCDF